VLAIIIAGGRGERMRRSGSEVPKALTPFNGQPLIAALCRHLQQHGVDRVVVALGHRAEETAAGLGLLRSSLTGLHLDWADTGLDGGNGGRLLRLGRYRPQQTFIMCWCDAITDLDIAAMHAAHMRHGRMATIAAVLEPPRWGQLDLDGERVIEMREKAATDRRWINGGYFVLEPQVLDVVEHPGESWENGALQRLVAADQLRAWCHEGFWAAIDTLADRDEIEARLAIAERPGIA